MTVLKNFRESDFMERARVLSEVEKENKFEAIPELFKLIEKPLNDQAMDSMVIHTLRSLLSQNEEETIQGLHSKKSAVKQFCVHMAGEKRFQSASPVLMELVPEEKDPDSLFEILSALSKIRAPESLDFFRKNARHSDPNIASLCLETLGLWEDLPSLELFTQIIEEGEKDEKYEECDLLTWNAIKATAALRNDAALSCLASRVNHRSPGARRILHQEIVRIGRRAIPFLAHNFLEDDVDAKIHTAQILGLIRDRKAGEVLAEALSSGAVNHPNIKYTVYESLGKIPFIKGIDYLLEGLTEENDLILMAAISSLNNRANSKVAERLKTLILAGNDQSAKIVNAIVTAKALNIFEALYENKEIVQKLLVAVPKSKDPVIITAFRAKLKSMKTGKAPSPEEMEEAPSPFTQKAGKRILAVDDSRLMLFFYRTAVSKMGLNVTTAINGHEAWDILEKGEEFDLVITDLNMPVMDGIEFTRKLRTHPALGKVKIIMATTESKQSQVDLAKKAGVDDFIQKPFSEEVLQGKIKDFLS